MKTTVIGAGAWGTAFALHLARRGHEVLLWVFEEDLCDIMEAKRENSYYLPGFALPASIQPTNDIKKAVANSDDIVLATPSFALRQTILSIAPVLEKKNFLILTKGIEQGTLLCMNEAVEEIIGGAVADRIATLSGPSFAKEVAQGAFTATVVASKNKALAQYFQQVIHADQFRVYVSTDILGVELGGALKNIMAIGAGIIQGLSLGTNTLAAYVTRALAEMKRLGRAMGAKETTFMGLSGIGDLILTSYGNLSRNRLFGIDLATGRKAADLLKAQKNVVEGYYTIGAVHDLAGRLQVEMPITEELFKIVYEEKEIRASMQDIIRRGLKEEDD